GLFRSGDFEVSNTGWEVAVVAFFNSKKVPVATLHQFSAALATYAGFCWFFRHTRMLCTTLPTKKLPAFPAVWAPSTRDRKFHDAFSLTIRLFRLSLRKPIPECR